MITKEEFLSEARDYFRIYGQDVTLATLNWEWERFQQGKSWFNEYLDLKEKNKNALPSV